MSQPVTLNLPDDVFQPVRRAAEAMNQSVEEILLNALQASLPSLDGLPPDIQENLTELETFDDESLRQVIAERVTPETQRQLSRLLGQKQNRPLTLAEERQLADCQHEADLVMLRKVHAAALLRFRGKRVPTLAELEHLSKSTS